MAYAIKEASDSEVLSRLFDSFVSKDVCKLNSIHDEHLSSIISFRTIQESLVSKLSDCRRKLTDFHSSVKNMRHNVAITSEESAILDDICAKIEDVRKAQAGYSDYLPKKPSWFLSQCIGTPDISLYWRKLEYKNNYENLKMNASVLGLVLLLLNWIFFTHRWCDNIFNSYILWYYSSLTLQEHILVANGSRIKLWWRLHHYLSVVGAGLVMIWPESESYRMFRPHFYTYSLIQCLVHIVQFYYQQGILYRLRALGLTSSMSLSVDGFSSFMLNGFAYLIAILLFCYLFQVYTSYVLFRIARLPICKEWQAYCLATLFAVVVLGNSISLSNVITSKLTLLKSKEKQTKLDSSAS